MVVSTAPLPSLPVFTGPASLARSGHSRHEAPGTTAGAGQLRTQATADHPDQVVVSTSSLLARDATSRRADTEASHRHDEAVPATGAHVDAVQWRDDLHWHRHMYKQSRFRWTAEHVFNVATIYTSGQLNFRTLKDLRKLRTAQDGVSDYGAQARNALGERLNALQPVLGTKSVVAAAVGLTDVEAGHATWNLTFTNAAERTNLNVRGVIEDLPFTSPLIEAWELAQLCRLYDATMDVMEDTLTDGAVELLGCGVPEQDVAIAVGSLTPEGLHARVRWVQEHRGLPGDPRRVPHQRFTSLA